MRKNQLFFSIIIPTCARPRQLSTLLQSIARLSYPYDRFEVIVVDDGSAMPIGPVVAPFCNLLNITCLTQEHSGPASARNTGAMQAKGDLLAFTDDDCEPASDWLKKLSMRFSASPDCIIGGRIINALPHNPYSTASQLLIDYLYTYYNADPDQAHFLTTNNLALPTKRFHEIGGFDTSYLFAAAEDRELCNRWLHHGYRMIYVPEAIVYHAHAMTLYTFMRQHFHYGRGAFCFHQVRSLRVRKRIKLEPVSFYLDLLKHPFLQLQSHQARLLTMLLIVSQVVHTSGFLWEVLNQTTEKLGFTTFGTQKRQDAR